MKTLLFIYNPTSGKGLIKTHLYSILSTFTKAGYLTTVYPTQSKGDAAKLAGELGGNYDRVVCSGGDGTLSETVSGLMLLSKPPVLGYIPAGSTNDSAHNFRLPRNLEKAAVIAAGDHVLPCDIGLLNQKSFVYVAAFGAFTDVAYDTPQELKNVLGHMAYVFSAMGAVTSITSYRLNVEHDNGSLEDDFLFGMVCNTVSVGGVQALSSIHVELDDGLFEVLLIRSLPRLTDLNRVLQSLSQGKAIDANSLVTFRTSRLKISCAHPLPWTIDGEYGGAPEITEIENRQKALRIVQGP